MNVQPIVRVRVAFLLPRRAPSNVDELIMVDSIHVAVLRTWPAEGAW